MKTLDLVFCRVEIRGGGTRVKRFVEGQDRAQLMLLPECLDDFVGEDNPVRSVRTETLQGVAASTLTKRQCAVKGLLAECLTERRWEQGGGEGKFGSKAPEFVVCPLMCRIRAFRYFWPDPKSNSPLQRIPSIGPLIGAPR